MWAKPRVVDGKVQTMCTLECPVCPIDRVVASAYVLLTRATEGPQIDAELVRQAIRRLGALVARMEDVDLSRLWQVFLEARDRQRWTRRSRN